MRKFEYKAFNNRLDEEDLNKLGDDGWELIIHTVAIGATYATQYYVFKREVKILDHHNSSTAE